MESKGWTIRKRRLNNKSRKGDYVYVKKPGKRGAYYKLGNVPLEGNIDYYVSLYEGNYGKGLKGRLSRQKKIQQELILGDQRSASQITHEEIIKKARKEKKAIDKLMGKGIWSTQITSASSKSPQEIKEVYKDLLFKAILSRDDQTLDLLSQHENIQKLKSRFEFKINIFDSGGRELVYLEKFGGKDLSEVIFDMKKFFGRGRRVTDYSPTHLSEIRKQGYNYFHKTNGVAYSFDIRLIMRKGR